MCVCGWGSIEPSDFAPELPREKNVVLYFYRYMLNESNIEEIEQRHGISYNTDMLQAKTV